MNLNNPSQFTVIDKRNMLGEIDGLPDQLLTAYQLGLEIALPDWQDIDRVVVAGMGGSAIGGSLAAAYISPFARVPVVIHRDYDLPGWASGYRTLVITLSHSGNTEETLSSFQAGIENNCRVLSITTGGKLAEKARRAQSPLWLFEHAGQPRAAVGLSFSLLLAAFHRTGLIPSREEEIKHTVSAMKKQFDHLKAEVDGEDNPAKQLAESLRGQWVSVFGAGIMAPVARRWKGQISELGKAWAQFEALPETDHNTLAGVVNPADRLPGIYSVFLKADHTHPRNQLRTRLTLEGFREAGIPGQIVEAEGNSRLSQMWTALHLGDYTAYYLAMLYEVDPSPVAAIENLKRALKEKS